MKKQAVKMPGGRDNSAGAWGAYLRVALVLIGAAIVIGVAGYFPTIQAAGTAGLPAMVAGIGVALAAALGGAAPPILALHGNPHERVSAMFTGIVVRFAIVILMTLAVWLSGVFEKRPLLVWTVMAYLAFMVIDNVLTVRLMRKTPGARAC
jgi:hypothetical protein